MSRLRKHRRVRLLLGVVVLLVTAGCSRPAPLATPSSTPVPAVGSSAAGSAPAGWTTYNKNGYSFSYPADWKLTERTQGLSKVVVVEGPRVTGDLPLQVVASTQQPFTGDIDGLIIPFEAIRKLPAEVKVRDERVSFAGAEAAQLTERTFATPLTAGGNARSRVRELRLVTPDQRSVAFLVRTAEADFASSPLPRVFDTLRIS